MNNFMFLCFYGTNLNLWKNCSIYIYLYLYKVLCYEIRVCTRTSRGVRLLDFSFDERSKMNHEWPDWLIREGEEGDVTCGDCALWKRPPSWEGS